MSVLESKITVTFTGSLQLTEVELRVLDAMAGYGVEPFLKVFYEKLGKAYMEPHERGVRTLFESIKREVPGQIAKIDEARRVLRMPPAPGPG